MFSDIGIENFDGPETEKLMFSGSETEDFDLQIRRIEDIEFEWSGDRKYQSLVNQDRKY